MLPEDKTLFPKCLYLDQNIWVELAQADRGMATRPGLAECLRAIRKAVADGTLVVPLSQVNIIEALVSGQADRRETMVSFMLGLSQGQFLANHQQILRIETGNAVRQLYARSPRLPVRGGLVGGDPRLALEMPPGHAAVPAQDLAALNPERRIAVLREVLLALGDDRPALTAAVAQERAAVQQVQAFRDSAQRQLSARQREVLAFGLALKDPTVWGTILVALDAIGVPAQRFCEDALTGPDALLRFAKSVPCLDLHVGLTLADERNPQRRYHCNDTRDLVWLSVAVPYANIVAGEAHWMRLSQPFARRYATAVTSSPTELLRLIQQHGVRQEE